MILAIDTATAACSVALFDGDAIVAEQHELVGRGHAERLIPMIAALPDGGRAERILVDCGPGSFTGVRVGLAAARALGLAWKAEVRAFSSMALIAAAAIDTAGERITIAITGGHGELFLQDYAGVPLRAMTVLASLTPAVAAETYFAERVFGSGAAALVSARGFGTAAGAFPRAADVGLLPPDLADLPPRPIYGRAPDAKLPA